jgi:hypothetical protein
MARVRGFNKLAMSLGGSCDSEVLGNVVESIVAFGIDSNLPSSICGTRGVTSCFYSSCCSDLAIILDGMVGFGGTNVSSSSSKSEP